MTIGPKYQIRSDGQSTLSDMHQDSCKFDCSEFKIGRAYLNVDQTIVMVRWIEFDLMPLNLPTAIKECPK